MSQKKKNKRIFSYNKNDWKLSRRFVLKGFGLSLGLPLLDVMTNTKGLLHGQSNASKDRVNILFGAFPHGHRRTTWNTNGTLKNLASRHRDYLSVLSGVNVAMKVTGGRRKAKDPFLHFGHWTALGTGITQMQVGTNFSIVGPSWDTLIANQRNQKNVTLGLHRRVSHRGYGGCVNALTYGMNNRRIDPSGNLANDFDKYVAGMNSTVSPGNVQKTKRELGKSILDFLKDEKDDLYRKVSSADKKILSSYFEELRTLEKKIDEQDNPTVVAAPEDPECKNANKAPFNNARLNYVDFNKRTADIIALLFKCGKSRIASHIFTAHHGEQSYGNNYHGSHHNYYKTNGADSRAAGVLQNVDNNRLEIIEYTANKLKSIPDIQGKNVLDNSILLYMCESSARHSRNNVPCILLGKGGGALSTGRDYNLNGAVQLDVFHTLATAVGRSVSTMGQRNNKILKDLLV